MAEKRVIEQTASSEIYNDDWFLKDSVLNGTTKISAENLAKGLIDNVDASDIAYDNSESGLTATNVQDAIDETFENAGKVDDVKVDGTSVVTNKVAEIEIPVKDVEVDGTSVVNASGVAEITLPDVPVQDVQVKTDSTYDSVVDASGNAKIDLSSVTAYGEVPNLPQAIATFKDGADAQMKSLKVAIEPQQEGSGDPSPTNIRPISGWDECKVSVVGKNFCEGTKDFLISYSAQTGVATRITGTGTCLVTHVKEGYTYTFSNGENVNRKIVSYWDSIPIIGDSTSYTQSLTENTFTAIKDGLVIIYIYNASIDTSVAQIELGSTATTYEPYNGATYTIDLDGTRYGGEVDVVNGTMTVDRGYVDLGSFSAESWTRNGVQMFWSHTIEGMAEGTANVMCSEYKYVSKSWTTLVDYEFGVSSNSIRLHNENVSTKEELANSLDGVQLVYELATPLTIQLTPTAVKSLLGSNNVWADTGDINDCIYRRDMSSTIDDIIARIEALEG